MNRKNVRAAEASVTADATGSSQPAYGGMHPTLALSRSIGLKALAVALRLRPPPQFRGNEPVKAHVWKCSKLFPTRKPSGSAGSRRVEARPYAIQRFWYFLRAKSVIAGITRPTPCSQHGFCYLSVLIEYKTEAGSYRTRFCLEIALPESHAGQRSQSVLRSRGQ